MNLEEQLQESVKQNSIIKIEAYDELAEKNRLIKHFKNEAIKGKSIILDICNKLGCKPEDLDKTIESLLNANAKTSKKNS